MQLYLGNEDFANHTVSVFFDSTVVREAHLEGGNRAPTIRDRGAVEWNESRMVLSMTRESGLLIPPTPINLEQGVHLVLIVNRGGDSGSYYQSRDEPEFL